MKHLRAPVPGAHRRKIWLRAGPRPHVRGGMEQDDPAAPAADGCAWPEDVVAELVSVTADAVAQGVTPDALRQLFAELRPPWSPAWG